jgi:phage regulator Rha-like protein
MAELEIIDDGGRLLVDSRLIADRLGIQHDNFLQTLATYETLMEQSFGVLLFQTGKPSGGSKGGRPSRYALLSEDQATFLMTLSRNSPEVVQCKLDLVKSFAKAKEILRKINPVADIDRVGLRSSLKDDSRLRMTDQVKGYLEQIKRYDDTKYRGQFFARVHDAINVAVTGETAAQMRARISSLLNRKVKESELIRDFFPSTVLQQYISMCETSANLMLKRGAHPLEAVKEAAELALPNGHKRTPIDFVEHIKFVALRVSTNQLNFPEGGEKP